jgi:hypothetical protein
MKQATAETVILEGDYISQYGNVIKDQKQKNGDKRKGIELPCPHEPML